MDGVTRIHFQQKASEEREGGRGRGGGGGGGEEERELHVQNLIVPFLHVHAPDEVIHHTNNG